MGDVNRVLPTRALGVVLLCALTVAGCHGVHEAGPKQSTPGAQSADPAVLARLRGGSMLTWRGEDQRIGYANMDKLAPTNLVRRGTQTSPLPDARRDFSTFRYTVNGTTHDLDHFMTTLNRTQRHRRGVVNRLCQRQGRRVIPSARSRLLQDVRRAGVNH